MKVLLLIWKNQLLSILAYRMSFLMQAGFMILNNFFFLWMWMVIFEKAGNIGGMTFKTFIPLLALGTITFTIMHLFFNGYSELSRKIRDGRLDGELLLPGHPLLRLLTSSMMVSAAWDAIYTWMILVIFVPELLTIGFLVKFLILGVLGSATFLGLMVMTHSLAFWTGSSEKFSDGIMEGTLASSIYPQSIYEGTWLKILFLTIMPAFFIAFFPYDVLMNGDMHWTTLALTMLGSLVFVSGGYLAFQKGIRHYESGNMMNTNH